MQQWLPVRVLLLVHPMPWTVKSSNNLEVGHSAEPAASFANGPLASARGFQAWQSLTRNIYLPQTAFGCVNDCLGILFKPIVVEGRIPRTEPP